MKLLKRNNKANDAEVDGNKTSKGSQKFSLRKNKTDNDDMTPHKPEDDEKSWWTHHTAKSAETEFSSSQAKQRREDGYIQKKVVFDQFGDFPKELLSVTADLKPKPESSTDVVIKVEASTVTLGDCLLRRGICFHVFDPVCLPSTPGHDVVGVISDVGQDVDENEWKKGDRVAALVRTGGNARYIVVPASSLVHVPKSLDASEAVCMVSTFMTAYQSLKMTLEPEAKKGSKPFETKKILVVGGVGPVGQALVQLALKAGASEVYATAPTSRHRFIKTVMGAKPLPFETEEWLPEVKGQMDIVFDGCCQDGYDSSQAALNDNGKLVTVGMVAKLYQEQPGLFGAPLSAFMTETKAAFFMSKTKTYEPWTSFKNDPGTYKADMEKLFNKLKKNQIRPISVKRIGLSDVADAQVFLEKGKARGPIVCIPWKRGPKNLHEDDHVPNFIETKGCVEHTAEAETRQEPEVRTKEAKAVSKKEQAPPKRRGLFRRSQNGEAPAVEAKKQKETGKKGKKSKTASS